MKYIKIRILEWRDNQAYDELQLAAAQLNDILLDAEAAKRNAAQIDALAKESQLPADLELAAAEATKARALASAAITARVKAKNASEAHSRKAFSHAKVGTFGYQEINPSTMEVARVLDEAGNPFPVNAVFGYEVSDANPPTPIWGVPDATPM